MNDRPDRPLRVLLMISSMRGGGSEQQTLLLLKHLDRARFIPVLYLLERTGEWLARVPEDVVIHSFDQLAADRGIYFPGRILRQQIRHVESVLQSEAIDVIYDRTFHMTMIAGPAAERRGVPRVSTIVSPPERAVPMVESRFLWWKRRRLMSAYRMSFRVVAVSHQAARSAQRYYRLHDQVIEVIPNPVDVLALNSKASVKTKHDQTQTLNLVCVGRMTAEKGHRDLIQAMIILELAEPQRIPPIRLRMIGDGPLCDELQATWQAETRRHQVEFAGRHHHSADEIRSADALVLPSLFEGMPNVVLEAMALRTPVIATRAGGTVELEHDEPTILWADPASPASLAAAIEALAADRSSNPCFRDAAQRVDAATRMVASFHDVNATTRRIESLLADAANQ